MSVCVFALIDSGANVSAISSKIVDKVREAGQRCIIYIYLIKNELRQMVSH